MWSKRDYPFWNWNISIPDCCELIYQYLRAMEKRMISLIAELTISCFIGSVFPDYTHQKWNFCSLSMSVWIPTALYFTNSMGYVSHQSKCWNCRLMFSVMTYPNIMDENWSSSQGPCKTPEPYSWIIPSLNLGDDQLWSSRWVKDLSFEVAEGSEPEVVQRINCKNPSHHGAQVGTDVLSREISHLASQTQMDNKGA